MPTKSDRPPREGSERTCIVTREAHSPEDLVRLVLGPDGRVEVDWFARAGGRGAWVLPRAALLTQLESRPGQLLRALDVERADVNGLLERARAASLRAVLDLLSLAARSGCLLGGAEALQKSLGSGDFLGIVFAADASERSVDAARAAAPGLPVWTLPIDRDALGKRIGKGARAAVALRPGAASRNLVRELRKSQGLR